MALFNFFGKKKAPTIPVPPAKEMEEFPLPSEAQEVKEAVEEPLQEEDEPLAPERETRPHPLFVKMPNYREVVDNVRHMSHIINVAEEGVDKLESTNNEKERAYKKWYGFIKELEEKLLYVDGELFKR